MKRIYTNFVQLVMSLTLIMLVGNTATAQCDIPPPEGSVWGTQFDGGLDGWVALDGNFMERKRADGSDIGWEWHSAETADARIQDGAFAGNAPAFASPSICNGAVLMNSDFLDNRGIPEFATGDCAATCASVLLSPTIDLSEVDASSFQLSLSTQHRNFSSGYSVLVSTDDGATWIDTVAVFPEGTLEELGNSPHLFESEVRFPLCDLGNEREVRLAVLYDANYYYWLLDDIHIIGVNQPDLQVNDNWVGNAVAIGTPHDQEIPMGWITDISNQSPVASNGSTLTVSVMKNGTEEVHSQVLAYDPIAGCADDQNRVLPELFTPDAAEGDVYTVTYTIADNEGDSFDANNTKSVEFYFTANEYIQVEPANAFRDSRFGAAAVVQSFGAAFKVVNAKDDQGNPRFLENVNFSIASDNADPLVDGSINVTLYEWIDVDMDGTVDPDPVNEKVYLGDTVVIITEATSDVMVFDAAPRDDNDNKIELKDNTQYIVMTHYNPEFGTSTGRYYHTFYRPSLWQNAAGQTNYNDTPMELGYVDVATRADAPENISAQLGTMGAVGVTHDDRDTGREYFGVGWGSMHINVEMSPLETGAEDINENIGINVYPNPTAESLTADVELENTSDVMDVEIMDMTGKVVMTKSYSNVKSQKVTLDIQSLTNGVYMLNIKSADGINSQKFTVQNTK